MTCTFSPSGNLAAVGGLDNICSIFDVSSVFKSSTFLASLTSKRNKLTRAKCELIGHEGYLSCCKFMDENTIITTSGDSTAIYWDIEKQSMISSFSRHTGDILSVCVDPPNHLCITASADATAKVWDYRAPTKCILDFSGFHQSDINWFLYNTLYHTFFFFIEFLLLLHSVQLFPNKRSFVTGSDDMNCKLFDLRAFQQMANYQSKDSICSVDVSISGYYLFVTSGRDFVIVWDTITAEEAYQLRHPHLTNRSQLSPNGHAVATGCCNFVLYIWS
ncbi:small G-beta protein GPB [Reticulomyxa filosa]|uniref:Small G-beta protein GPB n=1 Tax=Reticulomyxa filosa TaxID=46433 RepID=X6LV81_RETFI|nr:small G-beta protein GPB [Reticulomyxa filosa]|eukprot:ETO05276.1 small G-beta protein GPB [Reticulomyxa filosa]